MLPKVRDRPGDSPRTELQQLRIDSATIRGGRSVWTYRRGMSRRPRSELPGGLAHVTCRTIRRTPLFHSERDARGYLVLLDHVTRDAADWSVLAYCLMPNHVHLVVDCERRSALGRHAPRERPLCAAVQSRARVPRPSLPGSVPREANPRGGAPAGVDPVRPAEPSPGRSLRAAGALALEQLSDVRRPRASKHVRRSRARPRLLRSRPRGGEEPLLPLRPGRCRAPGRRRTVPDCPRACPRLRRPPASRGRRRRGSARQAA